MDLNNLARYFYTLFKDLGWGENYAVVANLVINLIILIFLAFLINALLRKFFTTFLDRLAKRTKTKFDDFLYQNKVIKHLTHLVTLFFIRWLLPKVLIDFAYLRNEVKVVIDIITIVILIWFIRSILLTFKDFLKSLNSFKDKPIESYIQVFMIFTWLIGFLFIFSILTGKSMVDFLTALGAVSAIILLIFKDTILGFVASIQVSVNDTVRIGDWITMEKYGADGDVIEINLSSVKVRNFDNTITTIPTYYLISDSFKNWRGMSVSGGRRIKRALIIKSTSIKFLKEDEVEKLKKIQLISTYLQDRQQEISSFNQQQNRDKNVLLNGRNMTNFGVFRKYIDEYLNQHSAINKEMMIMTRQLEPTPQGIPLEIYTFSKDKVWKNYEHIIADIFDHLLAAVPYFDLELFEYPTGKDFLREFSSQKSEKNMDENSIKNN
ncbi:mechanosensitive ion channel family protein [Mesonia maritima]|uniref:Miniconductance mechanosensitive channel n=1 Tax=Mesonia maritima TaxID=1793873 RepID=A0ABU1K939_9FLAO|nr:mechanosensitive ion channel family protein [Mesonia maritima]MDR6302118.1 miniconductance mechanosensitive channel [Mesonia maritima]